jgi:O-antigen/teichoic acid export membrane protein
MIGITAQAKLLCQRALNSRSFSTHVFMTMGTNLTMAVIGLITGTLAARILGPEGRGELAAIQTWPSFIAGIALLGLPEAIVYFSARDPRKSGQYMTTAMTTALILAIPMIVIGYGLMPFFLSAQSREIITAARWYLLYIFIQILVKMQADLLRGNSDLLLWNAFRFLPKILWLAVLLMSIPLGTGSPQWLAITFLIALSALFFPRLLILKWRLSSPIWPPDPQSSRAMLGYGLPLVAASVPSTLNLRMDQMLMTILLAPSALGLYVVAVAWSGAIAPLVGAIGQVVFPYTAGQASSFRQYEVLARGVRLASTISVALSIPLLAITPFAIKALYGPDFAPAIPTALILVIAGTVLSLKSVLQEGIRGLGQPKIVFWGECVGLTITIVVLGLLLGSIGILGAAIASLAAYIATVIYLIRRVLLITEYPLTKLLCPQQADLVLIRDRILALGSISERVDVSDK